MVALTCVPSQLYDHVYTFLVQNNLPKTAKYFKKETGSAVKIVNGSSLVEIFAKHHGSTNNVVIADPKEHIPEQNDSVFLHNESTDIKSKSRKRKVQCDDKPGKIKKLKKDKKQGYTVAQEEDAGIVQKDVTLGNKGEAEPKPEPVNKKTKNKKTKKENGGAMLLAFRSIESPGVTVPAIVADQQTETPNIQEEAEVPVSIQEVAEVQAEPEKKKKKKKNKNKEQENAATIVQDDAEVQAEPKKKKNKKNKKTTNTDQNKEQENAVPTVPTTEEVKPAPAEETASEEATIDICDTTAPTSELSEETTVAAEEIHSPKKSKTQHNHQQQHQKNAPFRRVIEEAIFVPNVLADNSFNAKLNSSGDWGAQASKDLIVTRGKSFRHEKTKKKRGSYRGGQINTSVSSIKYPSSDEE